MEPQIQYAKTTDGVSIAYWTMGDGMPLLCLPPLVFGHLQLEWQWPEFRNWYERFAEKRQLIRVDGRGMGLSERDIADFSLDACVLDLEAVADRLGLETFDLYAAGAGTRIAIAYAVRHPEQISHLILSRGYARARDVPGVEELLERDWELFTETLAHLLVGWSKGELAHRWAELIRASITHEVYKRAYPQFMEHDVAALLPQVRSPTLVLEGPPRLIGEFASGIPDARLVLLEEFSTLEGELDAALRAIDEFLGEGGEAEPKAELPEGMAVILFADIVESTSLTEQMGDAAFRDKARELDTSLRTIIRESAGTPVEGKLLGDGVLAVFTSARQAIECALRCQQASEPVGLELHLGIHAGDVIREGNNVYGGAVNIAARIAAASAPGEVLVSDTVRSLARTSAGVGFEDRGEQTLKGIAEPQRLYEIRWEPQE